MVELARKDFHPLFAPGAEFEGLVVLHRPTRIDAALRGALFGSRIWIGPSGSVEGTVEVDELVVEGQLAGDVLARVRAELRAEARVSGELRTARLAAEQGCRLNARCHTVSSPQAADRAGSADAERTPGSRSP
jgi:cytoskeletal protein CcmA (bactofilin family)